MNGTKDYIPPLKQWEISIVHGVRISFNSLLKLDSANYYW